MKCTVKSGEANIHLIHSLKQGDALFPLLFNSSLEHAIRKIQVNQEGLKLSGTHQLPFYNNDVNLLGENISNIRKIWNLLVASKEVGLEVHVLST
jgi:hypothetical protein